MTKLLKGAQALFDTMNDLTVSYDDRLSAEIKFKRLPAISRSFKINITGDVCVGDIVLFPRKKFSGSYKKPKFEGIELVEGEIVRDSYGADKQQHTFTIKLKDGSETRIKGRNLYDLGVWAKKRDESERQAALDEKHARGDVARKNREVRINGY